MEELIALARVVRAAFSRAYSGDLCGYCCRASVQLFLLARERGIVDARLAVTWGHVFVVLGDTIVDVTATQFGVADAVAVLPLEKLERTAWLVRVKGAVSHDHWEGYKLADSIEGLEDAGWEVRYFLDKDHTMVSWETVRHTHLTQAEEEARP